MKAWHMNYWKIVQKRNKWTFAVLLIVIFLWFATIISFVWYINQFDYVTEYTNSTNNGGNACIGDNCINGDSKELYIEEKKEVD